jgi:hypothetical protein
LLRVAAAAAIKTTLLIRLAVAAALAVCYMAQLMCQRPLMVLQLVVAALETLAPMVAMGRAVPHLA